MSPRELGTWLAVVLGVSGFVGTYFGGEFVSRYCGNDERRQLRMIALGYASFGVVSACTYISPNQYAAFGFMALAMLGGSSAIGPLFALIQTIVPARMRAQAVALIYLFANLIGMGLGPLVVGILSDALHPYLGKESLRYSLLFMSLGYLWGGWHAWRAARTVLHDLAVAESEEPAPSRAWK
jgi:MFS family permease